MSELKQQANSYKNVMELLVDEEIDRQMAHLTADEARAFNRIEIAAHALNRLPPLYASSEEGLTLQYEQGYANFKELLETVVQLAINIVRQTPERTSTPFKTVEVIVTEQMGPDWDMPELVQYF